MQTRWEWPRHKISLLHIHLQRTISLTHVSWEADLMCLLIGAINSVINKQYVNLKIVGFYKIKHERNAVAISYHLE